jgi:hypothetical protein
MMTNYINIHPNPYIHFRPRYAMMTFSTAVPDQTNLSLHADPKIQNTKTSCAHVMSVLFISTVLSYAYRLWVRLVLGRISLG